MRPACLRPVSRKERQFRVHLIRDEERQISLVALAEDQWRQHVLKRHIGCQQPVPRDAAHLSHDLKDRRDMRTTVTYLPNLRWLKTQLR